MTQRYAALLRAVNVGGTGNRVVAIYLDAAPPPSALHDVSGLQGERIALGRREI